MTYKLWKFIVCFIYRRTPALKIQFILLCKTKYDKMYKEKGLLCVVNHYQCYVNKLKVKLEEEKKRIEELGKLDDLIV